MNAREALRSLRPHQQFIAPAEHSPIGTIPQHGGERLIALAPYLDLTTIICMTLYPMTGTVITRSEHGELIGWDEQLVIAFGSEPDYEREHFVLGRIRDRDLVGERHRG